MHTGVTVKVGHKPRKLVMESKSGSLGYVFSCGLRTSFQPFHKYARTPSGVAAFAPGLGDSAENAPGKIPALEEIRNESHDYPHRVAKFPENRNRNRYRDVSPYDHSRVKLQNAENDYINASLVDIEEAQRSYILTQGPLPNTCCHFWLMVWQQKTKAVVMLNRIVEKESSGETRTISHFHYTTWPDFGVPESPASFLNFLFKVRESGSLNPDHGPAVIHCSAGIGRSGTFSLVDTCLVLMEKGDDINIKQVLLNMRKYRMGLIQTPDQLRFSYMAIIEGAKCIKGDSSIQKRWKELSKEDLSPAFDHSPNKIMTEKYNGNRIGLEEEKLTGDRCTGLSSKMQDTMEENSESALRKRIREDRKATTAQKVQQMKQRLNENERKRKRWLYWQPILTKMGFMSVILVGAFVGWTLFFQQNAL
ncbi:tyrosine-protein phosphatase non-receptor type 2 isoform X9 [Gorilla gorilla gorilla]|uniref:tyrosine-protein phosphatase non-receptor type 2 isoform X9 n=1 Tax=Gorilla gorilla gorilla TaxID=9595 RepID=UPI002445E923|nr:tyrosine-protein phosphatase non-receptor type 2 isoform X7 [Gorilla gorilla gorilla]